MSRRLASHTWERPGGGGMHEGTGLSKVPLAQVMTLSSPCEQGGGHVCCHSWILAVAVCIPGCDGSASL